MKSSIHNYQDFEQWLTAEQSLGKGSIKSYARDYLPGIDRHFESLRTVLQKAIAEVQTHDVDSVVAAVCAYLNNIYSQQNPPKIAGTTFSNYKSAVSKYVEFLDESDHLAGSTAPATGTTKELRKDFRSISKKDLEKVLKSRLRTQDRDHTDGVLFPNRLFSKKYLGTDDFTNEFINPQLKNVRVFIDTNGNSVNLSSVETIILREVAVEKCQVIAVTKDGEKPAYTRNKEGNFEPFVVKNIGEVSLDHFEPLEKIFKRLLDGGHLKAVSAISQGVRDILSGLAGGLRKMPSDKRRVEIFKDVQATGLLNTAVEMGIADEFQRISACVKLELMHKGYNSGKGARVN